MKHEVKLFMNTTSDCPIFRSLRAERNDDGEEMGTKATNKQKQVATRNFMRRKACY
jgi:hypothetical protein